MSKKLAGEPLVPKPGDDDGDGCWNCRFCLEVLGQPSESGWQEIKMRECHFGQPEPVLWAPSVDLPEMLEATFGWPNLLCVDEAWCSHHKPRRGDEGRSIQESKK